MSLSPQSPEVHILLNPDGSAEVEVFGVRGPTCSEVSKPYTSLFRTEGEVKKSEYHELARADAKQRQRL